MKPLLSLFCLVFCVYTSHAQKTVIYYDANLTPVTDSALAASKVILSKYADDTTLWAATQYTIAGQLMVEGVYKDRELATPDGQFKYYYNDAYNHYLKRSGVFFNGMKNGQWIEYLGNGKIMQLITYRGNVLNGLYEQYNGADSIPTVKGNYLNGKKNGEWITGDDITIYDEGIVMKSSTNYAYRKKEAKWHNLRDSIAASRHLINAVQPPNFEEYMWQKLSAYFNTHGNWDSSTSIAIQFMIDEKGKLSGGKALAEVDSELQERIAKVIDMASAWAPATENGKPVKQRFTYTFTLHRHLFRDQKMAE